MPAGHQAAGARVAGVPVLVARPAEAPRPWPLVLWCHGFRADALAHAAELEACALDGFLAVGIDAVGHGARVDPDLHQRLRVTPGGALAVMLEQVEATLHELPALVDGLAAAYGADRTRCSMVGISMGALLTYRAIAAGLPLRSAVALLGTPEWDSATSPHRALEAFRRVALLSITAEHDASVPPGAVHALHAALAARLPVRPSQHHVLAGAGHLTSAREWAEAMGRTTDWLRAHGRGGGAARAVRA
ncbi:MAG: dienelactone hydrolase family protein [Gemmatimonadaceae bacterium]|jgi:hypothetical protein|nr:dienelactone hydrolase family protein [Gemmatimonadaceae bacterium]